MDTRNRSRKVQQIIGRMTLPRVQMLVILAIAGVWGFMASAVLLRWFGLGSMAVRYPVAMAAAYVTFLLLLKGWISWQRGSGPDLDPDDLSYDGGWGSGSSVSMPQAFGGRSDLAGAGPGGAWTSGPGEAAGFSSAGEGGGLDLDAGGLDLDDLGTIVIAVVAILATLLAVFYVIYAAPVLLAEILIDAAVVGGLYRSMKNVERRHWLSTAVRKTAVPAVLAIILFGVAGYLFQKALPEARTIGQVWTALAG